MARVAFSLTDKQVAALVALHAGSPIPGEPGRHRVRLTQSLARKRLIDPAPVGGGWLLSARGSLAVTLVTG